MSKHKNSPPGYELLVVRGPTEGVRILVALEKPVIGMHGSMSERR